MFTFVFKQCVLRMLINQELFWRCVWKHTSKWDEPFDDFPSKNNCWLIIEFTRLSHRQLCVKGKNLANPSDRYTDVDKKEISILFLYLNSKKGCDVTFSPNSWRHALILFNVIWSTDVCEKRERILIYYY